MTRNEFALIDAQDNLSALIKADPQIDVDMDSGFVSMREPNDNDNLNFN